MKLALLLAEFLYNNKRLDLPGIGRFYLDPAALVQTETGKQQKSSITEGISFESDPAVKESPELIGFITSKTGKMKALASADLGSHLELAHQFLNIGKPFLLEGIGSLVKIRPGEFQFTAGVSILAEKLKDFTNKDTAGAKAGEEAFGSYDPHRSTTQKPLQWRKPALAFMIVLGAGLAIWGGYTVYKNNSNDVPKELVASTPVIKEQEAVIADNSQPVNNDSVIQVPPAVVEPIVKPPVSNSVSRTGKYKFVLETAGLSRATERYKRLKTFEWDVQMETADSVKYKLYLLIPALVSDTSRIMDSLTALNGRRVRIESF